MDDTLVFQYVKNWEAMIPVRKVLTEKFGISDSIEIKNITHLLLQAEYTLRGAKSMMMRGVGVQHTNSRIKPAHLHV
jgi:hypothetical protein